MFSKPLLKNVLLIASAIALAIASTMSNAAIKLLYTDELYLVQAMKKTGYIFPVLNGWNNYNGLIFPFNTESYGIAGPFAFLGSFATLSGDIPLTTTDFFLVNSPSDGMTGKRYRISYLVFNHVATILWGVAIPDGKAQSISIGPTNFATDVGNAHNGNSNVTLPISPVAELDEYVLMLIGAGLVAFQIKRKRVESSV